MFLTARGILLAVSVCMFTAFPAGAQMKTGEQMRDWFQVFSLNEKQRDFDYSAVLFRTNRESNIFYPGEKPELDIQIRATGKSPLKCDAVVRIIRWSTENVPGDIWRPQVKYLGTVDSIPLKIDLPVNGWKNFRIKPDLPEIFGGYAVVLEMGPYGNRFVSSMVRARENKTVLQKYPKQGSEFFPPATMERLGLQAVRYGIPFLMKKSGRDRERLMAKLDSVFREMKRHKIVATIEIGAGSFTDGQPLGMPRPHLDKNNVMLQTKSDMAWLPEHDPEFGEFCYEILSRYGWPKGPVNGIMLWNEPWEGISISGWGADMPRYLEMYKVMGDAVRRANRDAGVHVLIGGCDSSSNTLDKFFGDESDELLKDLDFCSIHYQGLSAPSLLRKWRDRKPERVLIWDTESWVANSEDLLGGVIAANRAAGYDRSMGFFGGYVFGSMRHDGAPVEGEIMTEKGKQKISLPLAAYPMAAGIAAMQSFIGDREFREILFREGLPWIFVFDGLNGRKEDGTVVVLGDLSGLFGHNAVMYPNVRPLEEIRRKNELRRQIPLLKQGTSLWNSLKKEFSGRFPDRHIGDSNLIRSLTELLREPWPFTGVSLEVDASCGTFALFDMYGNPVKAENGVYRIPLDIRGFYLRSTAPGGFDDLLTALKRSCMTGMQVVELIPRDFLESVKPGARLRMTVHNLLNRPLNGCLKGHIEGLSIQYPERLSLAPFESREVIVTVKSGNENPRNLYPLYFAFDAGNDGFAEVRDTMRSNVIIKRTVKIDGFLDDWKGVIPQIVSNDGTVESSLMEKAWLPFEQDTMSRNKSLAMIYTAYDNRYFYFAAKVSDRTVHPGTLRFETRDDAMFYYPEVTLKYNTEKTFLYEVQKESASAVCGIEKPGKPGVRVPECIRPSVERLRFDLTLPEDRLTKVTLYFPWSDFRSGREAWIRFLDRNGKELTGSRRIWSIRDGAFVSCEAAGTLSLEIVNPRWWHKESGRVAGIFFDRGSRSGFRLSQSGAYLKFLGLDEKEPGKWIGRFGSLGYLLPGLGEKKLDRNISCVLRNDDVKDRLVWPEGVRRYSYRMRPILPDGASSGTDNIQIAFNVLSMQEDPVTIANLPGRMPGFVNYNSSDYEFALNKVASEYGGGTEIWRLQVPDGVRKHFYPRQPKAPWEGAVKNGSLVIVYKNETRFVEAAIPWNEIPLVKKQMEEGKTVKFSFRVNDDGASPLDFGKDRAVTRKAGYTFHPDWKTNWTNEIEFRFEP